MDLTRKEWFVYGDNLKDPTKEVTNFSVVSRDTIYIILKTETMNELYARFFNLGNFYLKYKKDERVYFISGT